VGILRPLGVVVSIHNGNVVRRNPNKVGLVKGVSIALIVLYDWLGVGSWAYNWCAC
jgi:hypothetical protein